MRTNLKRVETGDASLIPQAVSVYVDGGVIISNPSPYGGTWAARFVDPAEDLLYMVSGVVEGVGITNNHTEMVAAVEALLLLPKGWAGTFYSDSQVTLGRLFNSWALNGVSRELYERIGEALRHISYDGPDLPPLTAVLLQGHPTKEDLKNGIGSKRGLPVSIHNVACDTECNRLAKAYLEERRRIAGIA